MLEQLMRGYMDMMGMLGAMISGLARPPYPRYPQNQSQFENRREGAFRYNPGPAPHPRSLAINVEVASSQANQVSLDLKALPPRVALSIEPLPPSEDGKPEIRDVRLEISGDRYVLRIRIPDAHDRYANQEVSYLLQRIETFDGIAILSSNFKENLDTAFTRRFESIIYFPMPRPEERARIWRQGFSKKARLDESIDLDRVAREHVLSGGSVMNVIRFVSLHSLKDGERSIGYEDLMQGIRREYAKEGRAH
jgi:SpoVK/Ycf46/Vps4 family AAA+-type ATPase